MTTVEDLLKNAESLPPIELDRLMTGVLKLRSRRRHSLPKREATLLLKINEPFSPELMARSHALIRKRQAETLTEEERNELIQITDAIEELGAQRLTNLSELARLRDVDLKALMDQLGIFPVAHA